MELKISGGAHGCTEAPSLSSVQRQVGWGPDQSDLVEGVIMAGGLKLDDV